MTYQLSTYFRWNAVRYHPRPRGLSASTFVKHWKLATFEAADGLLLNEWRQWAWRDWDRTWMLPLPSLLSSTVPRFLYCFACCRSLMSKSCWGRILIWDELRFYLVGRSCRFVARKTLFCVVTFMPHALKVGCVEALVKRAWNGLSGKGGWYTM